jgi:hypothetical protein
MKFKSLIGTLILAMLGGATPCPASATQYLNWDCHVNQVLVGHWEVTINDVDSKFVYLKSLNPGDEPIELPLQNIESKQIGKWFEFTSDELSLEIDTTKKINNCPVYGETCFQATLKNLRVGALGPETSKELTDAPWSCAPQGVNQYKSLPNG